MNSVYCRTYRTYHKSHNWLSHVSHTKIGTPYKIKILVKYIKKIIINIKRDADKEELNEDQIY